MKTERLGSAIRSDFPFYENNPGTAFLDSGASSLTPRRVIEAVNRYYNEHSVNIHRGVYRASQQATEIYEGGRRIISDFLKAGSGRDVIYVRNATEGFNLLARSLGDLKTGLAEIPRFASWTKPLQKDDVIVITESEHHANIVPWQMLAERTGCRLVYVPILGQSGILDTASLNGIRRDFSGRIRIVSVSQASNVTGIVHDLKPFHDLARESGALYIIDGAQGVCHLENNLEKDDIDFYLFSGHKMLGPTGIGIVCGRSDVLNLIPPFQGGGDMILDVSRESSLYQVSPHKFEAGTPHIAGVYGLAAAVEYLSAIGWPAIHAWEEKMTGELLTRLENEKVNIFGPTLADMEKGVRRIGAVSFNIGDIHPHDIGTILDQHQVAIRVGHHCCQLLMKAWRVPATNRASLYLYNDSDDIDRLLEGLTAVRKIFSA